MGNRTFLGVLDASGSGSANYDRIDETNNSLALEWFAFLPQSRFERFRSDIQAYEEAMSLDGSRDGEDGVPLPSIDIPYADAIAQFNEVLPGALQRYPEMAGPMARLFDAIDERMVRQAKPSLNIDLIQYWNFFPDSEAYLADLAKYMSFWDGRRELADVVEAYNQSERTQGLITVPQRQSRDERNEVLNALHAKLDAAELKGYGGAPSTLRKKSFAAEKENLVTSVLAVLSAAAAFAGWYLSGMRVWVGVVCFFAVAFGTSFLIWRTPKVKVLDADAAAEAVKIQRQIQAHHKLGANRQSESHSSDVIGPEELLQRVKSRLAELT